MTHNPQHTTRLTTQNPFSQLVESYNINDPECDIDCVPNEARKKEVKIALNNSYAFGGNNACLVLRKV
ncbi:MAG: hypothetical protein FJZ16_07875 [Candidatus Omnitrophica bacterium]|nr:hypothetical protein [Candidatus Omnitrophota bacterium]